MVTCRELIENVARIVVTFVTAIYAFVMILFLLLRIFTGERLWFIAMLNNFAPYCFMPVIILVVLALSTRSRWALAASVSLMLIAGITYRDYWLPRAGAAASGDTIHMVTFNFYRGNDSLEQIENWLNEQDAALVLMQEVPQEAVEPFIARMSDRYPFTSSRTATGSVSANLLLSTYPILSVEDLQQPTEAHSRQRYVIGQSGSEIAVYNIDVALPVNTPRIQLNGEIFDFLTGYDAEARDANLRVLLERIRQEPYPYIVAGDFSMSDQTGMYQELAGVMRDSYREAGSGIGATWPVNSVENMLPQFVPPLFRVDYVWHSEHFRAIQAQLGSPLDSDHLPLEVTLQTDL